MILVALLILGTLVWSLRYFAEIDRTLKRIYAELTGQDGPAP